MLRKELALSRIAQVREAAEDVDSAYLLRVRLHRMLLSIQRALAAEMGKEIRVPGIITFAPDINDADRRIIELCNSIILDSKHLSQRSESLDVRWQKNWQNLEASLNSLHDEILSY